MKYRGGTEGCGKEICAMEIARCRGNGHYWLIVKNIVNGRQPVSALPPKEISSHISSLFALANGGIGDSLVYEEMTAMLNPAVPMALSLRSNLLDEPFTEEEIEAVLKKMVCSASGEDRLTVEQLKSMPVLEISELFISIQVNLAIPSF